jgi:sulfite reductase alpha subunit-like flavoprotein
LDSELTEIVDMPPKTISFEPLQTSDSSKSYQPTKQKASEVLKHPPSFVTPHPPFQVFSAPLFHARELTKPGAEKRTYHFDIDVTDYPKESGDVDFVVGGAIGVCAPNSSSMVDHLFQLLGVPTFVRDKPILLKTTTGRWPTIWGEEEARELVTTRRELLTWCSDIQSYPPTKHLFRLLAEYAEDEHEKKILTYLSSAQGQAAFCDLRTGPYTTISQFLNAFPSSRPPLDYLMSVLNTLMPRFYSLSQDPMVSYQKDGTTQRRLIEIAVTVHEADDWATGLRTGVGSGFLERLARQVIQAEAEGRNPRDLDLRVPMFRGLMANPLAREFISDGPMLLIGAGVGIAPFRGFVHRRLKSANCANKVWVLQGVRDSLLDELYSGDWGVHEDKVKKVVQSRRGAGRYVQEEVKAQADLVWFIINALDGRVFVCGSSKGMGEGVEAALVDVAMVKGKLNEEEAHSFWEEKKNSGQYIAETW